jgi:hypothetical protein
MTATKISQLHHIAADLLAGVKVHSVYAFHAYGITRLSSIIERLRKRGWPIITHRMKRNGLAVYTLPEVWRPPAQKTPDTKKAG